MLPETLAAILPLAVTIIVIQVVVITFVHDLLQEQDIASPTAFIGRLLRRLATFWTASALLLVAVAGLSYVISSLTSPDATIGSLSALTPYWMLAVALAIGTWVQKMITLAIFERSARKKAEKIAKETAGKAATKPADQAEKEA